MSKQMRVKKAMQETDKSRQLRINQCNAVR